MTNFILFFIYFLNLFLQIFGQLTTQTLLEPAVRIIRLQVLYPDADIETVNKLPNWNSIMRKSVLASLRFVNKHWLICGESSNEQINLDKKQTIIEKTSSDCGHLQVTGEQLNKQKLYRLNATFIANMDPIQNSKSDSNSTVHSVLLIGIKGGIFQYTNAMKILGKPNTELGFEEAFFCYPEQELIEGSNYCNKKQIKTNTKN
ncbi:hypothetical protein Mgra_00003218 [Meloidogyne graminicola]|uniref:Uncharacterized protein n=1 Tax=Meloidogyne graminicola TaxID=189291 RepID=A0A8S9ZWB9_9BILA|nr:hypothetical protein Mgra_00003218 [Meloidogyne graminicola]